MSFAAARRVLLVYLLLVLAIPARASTAAGTVHYEVEADPAARRFHVTLRLDPGPGSRVRLAIPAWTPGYYQILHYEKEIDAFDARDAQGRTLPVTRPDTRTWEVGDIGEGPLAVSYDVKATDAGFGFFGSHLDERTGYINGASALMYVVNETDRPAVIAYRLPEGWEIACALDPEGPFSFRAETYDTLIDAPAQMGRFERRDFKVRGVPFAVLLVGDLKGDRRTLVEMLSKVGAAGIDLFGNAPFKRYLFIIHGSVGNFGGGLEHAASTVLNVGPSKDPARDWMGLAAHEYFHAWNVKRLRPAVLGPFDYTREVRTGDLWFAEGVTEYYAWVLPRMAGLTTAEEFCSTLAVNIRALQRTDARHRLSVEEASRKGWEGGSEGFGGLSYYLKGSLLGLLFDIRIRSATDNARSLDDVMRLLEREYGRKDRGYDEDALRRALNTVAGQDLSDLYERYVRGTEEIPWDDVLREAGLTYAQGTEPAPYLGVATEETRGGVEVTDVVKDSPADLAGLQPGDRINGIDGSRISSADWRKRVEGLQPGQSVTLRVLRGGRRADMPLTVGARDREYTRVAPLPDADARARRVRAGLLRLSDRDNTVR